MVLINLNLHFFLWNKAFTKWSEWTWADGCSAYRPSTRCVQGK